MAEPLARTNAASTDVLGSATCVLAVHVEPCRPDDDAMWRAVGGQPGSLVPNAACGSGGCLRLVAEQIGPRGATAACDRAPDCVAARRPRVPCAVVTIGALLDDATRSLLTRTGVPP